MLLSPTMAGDAPTASSVLAMICTSMGTRRANCNQNLQNMHDSTGVPDDPQRRALPQAHGDGYACQTSLTSMETKLVMQCTSGFAARTRPHVSSAISTGMACTRSFDVTGAHAHLTTTSSQSPDRDVSDFSCN